MLEQRITREPTASYPEAGYCIYCGARNVTLTDEHIVPYGLGGHYLFPKASCVPCQKAIHRAETIVMREMLRPYRVRIGLVGKHRDSNPNVLPLEFIRQSTGGTEKLFLPPTQYPTAVVLMKFEPPGLLLPITLTQHIWRPWFYLHDVESLNRTAAIINDTRAIQAGRFYPIEFCRVLAKMAHAYAVADGIAAGFSYLLTDLIRGLADQNAFKLVGGIPREYPPEPEFPHKMILTEPRLIRGKEYIVAQIRLFAYLGTPIYEVVVAERAGQNIAAAEESPNAETKEFSIIIR